MIVAYFNQTQTIFDYSSGDLLLIIGPAGALLGVLLSNLLFKTQLKKVKNSTIPKDKLESYIKASIMKFAPLEGASLFNTVLFLLSGNLVFALIAALLICYLISLHPTKNRINNDLDITKNSGSITRN